LEERYGKSMTFFLILFMLIACASILGSFVVFYGAVVKPMLDGGGLNIRGCFIPFCLLLIAYTFFKLGLGIFGILI